MESSTGNHQTSKASLKQQIIAHIQWHIKSSHLCWRKKTESHLKIVLMLTGSGGCKENWRQTNQEYPGISEAPNTCAICQCSPNQVPNETRRQSKGRGALSRVALNQSSWAKPPSTTTRGSVMSGDEHHLKFIEQHTASTWLWHQHNSLADGSLC